MADFYGPSHRSHGSVSGSVAAVKIQNSDCTAKWFSTHGHIDCNRVPFSIGFDSITSEILVNALSDRYTHWSSVHNKKCHSCIGNETETYENRN